MRDFLEAEGLDPNLIDTDGFWVGVTYTGAYVGGYRLFRNIRYGNWVFRVPFTYKVRDLYGLARVYTGRHD